MHGCKKAYIDMSLAETDKEVVNIYLKPSTVDTPGIVFAIVIAFVSSISFLKIRYMINTITLHCTKIMRNIESLLSIG